MTEADILEFRNELTDRRRRLEGAVAGTGGLPQLTRLLQEVDEALQRIEVGLFGRCDTCHDDIEKDRLRIDPLIRTCLDHLTPEELSELVGTDRKEVVRLCLEESVPIYNGRIDKTLFARSLIAVGHPQAEGAQALLQA